MYIGADYYPEHWPREKWDTYAAQMREANFNVVRLAEFAWVVMEPEEGRYEFDWLDDAIKSLHAQNISVLLGTPTAVMPAWLATKYPTALAQFNQSDRATWGVRKNNCFSSEIFNRFSEQITTAMAERYAKNPAVIGWQTDNEFDGPVCYCNDCLSHFHTYLHEKYETIDRLNTAWGTHFWGHLFSAFEQIPVANNFTQQNPSHCLDWQRFQTFLQVRFQRAQVRIIRKHCPGQFITHNFMGLGNISNTFELAKDLDFASYDSYPIWGGPDISYDTAASCDLTRALLGKNFWIMETTAGPCGWSEFSRNPRPGEMRKIFYQHLAHGADAQLFFRWRTCTAGREQYWHGLLGHDGKLLRRYEEAKQLAAEGQALSPQLLGTTLVSDVAIIFDYDSRWATTIQPSFKGNVYDNSFKRYHTALFRAGVNVDVIQSTQDFFAYRVIIAPQLYVLPDEVARRLAAFVEAGGVLLADIRTGVKDSTSLCHERTLPGLLGESLGITIEEYEGLTEDIKIIGHGPLSGTYTAHQYGDWITLTGAESLATYDAWHLAGFSAATRQSHGKGSGYYVGTVIKEDSFYDSLIRDVLKSGKVQPLLSPPPGVEISVRTGTTHHLVFIINHTQEKTAVALPFAAINLLTGNEANSSVELDRFGIAVLQIKSA